MGNKKNYKQVNRTELPGSPFVIVTSEGNVFLTMGKYRISDKTFETEDECESWLKENTWNVLCTLCGIIVKYHMEEHKKELIQV